MRLRCGRRSREARTEFMVSPVPKCEGPFDKLRASSGAPAFRL
jgi:hypothetical protein